MQLQTPMKTIENLQRCIKDSNHIVAILGIEMLVESGGRNFDSNEESYRMEEEYGACPEELLSGSFYCAKKERFYKFYKKEMLGMKIGATAGYEALYKLQQQGKLHTVINRITIQFLNHIILQESSNSMEIFSIIIVQNVIRHTMPPIFCKVREFHNVLCATAVSDLISD